MNSVTHSGFKYTIPDGYKVCHWKDWKQELGAKLGVIGNIYTVIELNADGLPHYFRCQVDGMPMNDASTKQMYGGPEVEHLQGWWADTAICFEPISVQYYDEDCRFKNLL